MWISVRDKETILPSMSKVILVTDGQNYQLVSVEKFLETVDTPYNTWTHWMKIPKVEKELVSEEELDRLTNEYVRTQFTEDNVFAGYCRRDFKAGYRKAKENNYI